MKIQMYYNPAKDCVQMVQDGVLKQHNEGISSSEFVSYFKEDMEDLKDIKLVSPENILQGYEAMKADCIYYEGEQFYNGYKAMVRLQDIEGELIYESEVM